MKPSRDTRSLCPFSSVGTLTLVTRVEWHRRQFQRLTRTSILRTDLNSHRCRQRLTGASTPRDYCVRHVVSNTTHFFYRRSDDASSPRSPEGPFPRSPTL